MTSPPDRYSGAGIRYNASMRCIYIPAILLLLGLLSGCAPDRSHLEQIKFDKTLTVVTRNSPTTYYHGPSGPTGLEYDLAKAFADSLGVKLKILVEENLSDMFRLLAEGKADIAAAGLTITKPRREFLAFGPSYIQVTPQLVYRIRNNDRRPRKIADLIGKDIEVVANSSHAELLRRLKQDNPELEWSESQEHNSDELMQLVWTQFIDYTVADSTELKMKQRFYPELAVAFNVKKPDEIAWAMHKSIDDSLVQAVHHFFQRMKDDDSLKVLHNKYYGHIRKFNYVGTQAYMRDIQNKLPEYIDEFKRSAKRHNLDWRLLAAVGYQESHWNPDAVSPTGVRGIMMLTHATAKFVGIEDRRDPIQSIQGGAQFLRHMIDTIPERIEEPDRTWMALAAYNVGYGHLEDARKITQQRNGNPDKWVDVKENLPLLSKKKWYSKTKYGYARGYEPVGYVENIRNYHELLVWQGESESQANLEIPDIPDNLASPAL